MYIDVEIVKERIDRYMELSLVYPLVECSCGCGINVVTDMVLERAYISCDYCGYSKPLPHMFLDDDMDAFLSIQENFEKVHS